MNKPYLLTLSSETKGMDRFRKSLDKLEGNFEHIAVQFAPPSDMATTAFHNIPYPGHLQRHFYIPDNLDKDRHIIFCDTDDVIFQKPFPEFTQDIYLACENVLHKDTIWNNYLDTPIFKDNLLNREVYNCGMYVMKVSILYEYREFLREFTQYAFEQLPFNLFLIKHPEYSKVIDLSILCPLYKNLELGLVKKEKDIWVTKSGKVISCVHSNGNKIF